MKALILLLLFVSCSTNGVDNDPYVEEFPLNEQIFGTWYNQDDDTTVWIYPDGVIKYSQGKLGGGTGTWTHTFGNDIKITGLKWKQGRYDDNNVNGDLHLWSTDISDYFDKF